MKEDNFFCSPSDPDVQCRGTMPDCGRFNEWGCDGAGSSENVRNNLSNYLNTHGFIFYINLTGVNVF